MKSLRLMVPAILMFGVISGSCSGLEVNDSGFPSGALAIMQGASNSDTAQIGVLLPKSGEHEVSLTDLKTGFEQLPDRDESMERKFSDWKAASFEFRGLSAATIYGLSVFRKEKEGRVLLDYRRVRVPDFGADEATVAVVSCMDDAEDYLKDQELMWKQLLGHSPKLAFFIGDNVYADRTVGFYKGPAKPDMIWNRYVETRNTLAFFRSRELVPVYAIWDDHDYGMNDGDGRFPHKEESKKVFEAFFPRAELPGAYVRGPGISRALTAYGQTFLFLDNRSFRSPNRVDSPDQTHWGKAQEKWINERIEASSGPVWLVNGDQFFGGYHRFESYEGNHPESFRELLARLRKASHPVVFVSGDRHLAELMRISEPVLGYETYEITTSAIHAKTFPGSFEKEPNPRQIAGRDGILNYAILRIQRPRLSGSKIALNFRVSVYGPAKEKLFERDLSVRR